MTAHVDIDPIGDLRAAIDARAADPGAIAWVTFALLNAHGALPDLGARDAATRMALDSLTGVMAGRASARERLEFIALGLPALTRRVSRECPWVLDAALAARTWAAAFAWQSIAHLPDAPAAEGMHTCMGLGGGLNLALQWDTSIQGMSVRHVTLAHGSMAPGQLNTFANLSGYPDLPEHLEPFGPPHVDPELFPLGD